MALKKDSKIEVSFLVVNYKQQKDLELLKKQVNKNVKNFDYEFLIFDSSNEYKEGKGVFKLGKNIGYGSAVNYLSTKAKGKFLIVLNPDVEIEGNLDEALKKYKNSDLSYGIFSLGKAENLYTAPFLSFFKNKKRFSSYGFIIEKDLFKSMGGFDVNMFLYFEDDDLALRLKEISLKTIFSDKPYITHKKTYSNIGFGKRKYYYYCSLLVFLKKHQKTGYLFWFLPLKLLTFMLSFYK